MAKNRSNGAYRLQNWAVPSEGTHPKFAKQTKGRGVPKLQQITKKSTLRVLFS